MPGKFDLSAAYEDWDNRRRITETRERLRESKERISQSIERLPFDWSDGDLLISYVVLQAVCEEVTLTLMNVRIDADVHALVNVAAVWALREMGIFGHELLADEEFALLSDFGLANWRRMFPLTARR